MNQKFYNDQEKVIFSVVYDCGMGINQQCDAHLPYIINKAYEDDKEKTIDLIFISHFDCDHVNGITCLCENNLIAEKTIVVVPFSEESKELFYFLYPYVKYVFRALSNSNAKIVYMRSNDAEENIYGDPIRIEELKDGSQIQSGQIINYEDIWCYIPFNLGENNKWHELIGPQISSLKKSLSDRSSFNPNDVNNIMKEIRDNYKKLQKCFRSGSANSINMNSMQLLSLDSSLLKQASQTGVYEQYPLVIEDHVSSNMLFSSVNSSCLYTGDTTLTDSFKKFRILEFVFKRLDEVVAKSGFKGFYTIGMMQIPHHGSCKCYTPELANHKRIASAFVNHSLNGKAKFDARIITDFERVQKPLFRVTDNECSRTTFTYPI